MEEIWKDIPKYEGMYQVSNLGNVRSLDRMVYPSGCKKSYLVKGKNIKPVLGREGYYQIGLYRKDYKEIRKPHQLVAMAFLGFYTNGKNKIVIDHIDNNKLNNQLTNLQVISQRANATKSKLNKGSSKYTGVSWHKGRSRWYSSICINKKKVFLGRFKCELVAAVAYNKALKRLQCPH